MTTTTIRPRPSTTTVTGNEAPAFLAHLSAATNAVGEQLKIAQEKRTALRDYVINLRTDGAMFKTRTEADTWEAAHQRLIQSAEQALETTAFAVNLERVDAVVTQLTTFTPRVRSPREERACRDAVTRLLRASADLHSVCEEHSILSTFVRKIASQGASYGIARPRHSESDWRAADTNLRNAAKKNLRDSFDV